MPLSEALAPIVSHTIATRQITDSTYRGFTLIETAVTICVLVVVLGLAVSLARRVREDAAHRDTMELMAQLETLAGEFRAAHGRLPEVPRMTDPEVTEESMQRYATSNNEQFIQSIRAQQADVSSAMGIDLPLSMYDQRSLRDAWGSPIVFMPAQHPAIGMAPQDHFFLFSAGPDRQYLTREDNLYSYER